MPTFAFHFPCHIRVSHFFYVFRPVYIRHILLWHVIQFMERFFIQTDLYHWYFHLSMTSLLTHTVAHSTRPSFRPKTNNQPVFKSCCQLSKKCKQLQNSDFQSQFSMSKMIRIFLKKFFIEEYNLVSTFFVIDIFWQLQFLNHFIF